jgi:3-methyladenine DNA glycosylase AlkD
MINPFHSEILDLIKKKSGKPTQHTFLDSYLGNTHPRYPINAPALRTIAKTWMREHREMSGAEFTAMLTSLIEGVSSTEKVMAGILMDYATAEQQDFDPKIFDHWLDHLIGWAEVDAVCTGAYTIRQIPSGWKKWKPLLRKFSKDNNIHKRRASLVFFCSPVRHVTDEALAEVALENVDRLKSEKHVLITKAISWVLRSMVKNFKKEVSRYIQKNSKALPAIAVRETNTVLKTGKKTKTI